MVLETTLEDGSLSEFPDGRGKNGETAEEEVVVGTW